MKINVLKMQILMGEQNMNIKKLAEKSKVSRQTISYIKSGKSCSPPVVCKIAKALGVEVYEILEGNAWTKNCM